MSTVRTLGLGNVDVTSRQSYVTMGNRKNIIISGLILATAMSLTLSGTEAEAQNLTAFIEKR